MEKQEQVTMAHDEANRERLNKYLRTYRANHPETTLRWRINSAVSLLARHGWRLIPPTAEGGESNE